MEPWPSAAPTSHSDESSPFLSFPIFGERERERESESSVLPLQNQFFRKCWQSFLAIFFDRMFTMQCFLNDVFRESFVECAGGENIWLPNLSKIYQIWSNMINVDKSKKNVSQIMAKYCVKIDMFFTCEYEFLRGDLLRLNLIRSLAVTSGISSSIFWSPMPKLFSISTRASSSCVRCAGGQEDSISWKLSTTGILAQAFPSRSLEMARCHRR